MLNYVCSALLFVQFHSSSCARVVCVCLHSWLTDWLADSWTKDLATRAATPEGSPDTQTPKKKFSYQGGYLRQKIESKIMSWGIYMKKNIGIITAKFEWDRNSTFFSYFNLLSCSELYFRVHGFYNSYFKIVAVSFNILTEILGLGINVLTDSLKCIVIFRFSERFAFFFIYV